MKKDPIVDVLRHFRVQRRMSQKALAGKIGVSGRTIQRYESGETDMTLGLYRQWMEALSVTDMDVALALFHHDLVAGRDVEAAARRLPMKVRRVVLRFLLDLPGALR